jgi:hypothetical protein
MTMLKIMDDCRKKSQLEGGPAAKAWTRLFSNFAKRTTSIQPTNGISFGSVEDTTTNRQRPGHALALTANLSPSSTPSLLECDRSRSHSIDGQQGHTGLFYLPVLSSTCGPTISRTSSGLLNGCSDTQLVISDVERGHA